jgi:hypothetical protein
MKRFVISLVVLAFALAEPADAEVDPLNWCFEFPTMSAPLMSEQLVEAVVVSRSQLAHAESYVPGQLVAQIEFRPAPRRILQSPLPELGLREGGTLTPMTVLERGYGDRFWARQWLYCGRTEVASERSNAICLGEIDATTQIARSAHHAQMDDVGGGAALSGRLVLRRDYPLGRLRDWAVLGDEIQGVPAFTRSLTLDVIETRRQQQVFSRPAHDAIRLRFTIQGYPQITRGLNQPLQVDGAWLVVTDITEGGAASISRMSNEERLAFQRARCPAR